MASWGDWQAVLNNADIDTARLIIELQLEDVHALQSAQHVHPTSTHGRPDNEVAGLVYKKELKSCDADLPSRQLRENLEDDENGFEGALEAAAFGWKYDEYKNTIERVPEPARLLTCIACTDNHRPDNIVQMPCSHHYCKGCLEDLYMSCMTDETLFPPRCCHQEFPYNLLKHLLSQRCKSQFGQKRVELETKDRTYCHIPTCSAFIKPSDYVGDAAPCPKNHGYTCTRCKTVWHHGQCPRNEEMEVIMGTAEQNQWQRCYACRRVIELKTGCNHITCVCRSQFCYVCGLPWKTCNCAQWDEARLIERAEAFVNNGQAPPANRQPQGREAQVAQAAQHLRDHHECNHDTFRYLREPGAEYECEMCNETYPNFISQCRQCWMIVCGRCKHNRL